MHLVEGIDAADQTAAAAGQPNRRSSFSCSAGHPLPERHFPAPEKIRVHAVPLTRTV